MDNIVSIYHPENFSVNENGRNDEENSDTDHSALDGEASKAGKVLSVLIAAITETAATVT